MPRIKASAPKRRPIDEEIAESGETSRKRPKRESWFAKRRLLSSDKPSSYLLGDSPMSCTWAPPQDCSNRAPNFICAKVSNTGTDINLFADFSGGIIVPLNFVPPVISHLLSSWPRGQYYSLICAGYSNSELLLDISVNVLPWPDFTKVIEYIYSRDYSDYAFEIPEENPEMLVSVLSELSSLQAERRVNVGDKLQHKSLKPKLRGYQSAAVHWMISREQTTVATVDLSWADQIVDKIPLRDGTIVLYNKYTGVLSGDISPALLATGGILADEMGLGKTVVTLALLLNHQRSPVSLPAELAQYECEESSDSDSDRDSSDCYDTLFSEVSRNKETCLDANERLQLIPSYQKPGILREKLTEWYEIKLAEMSSSSRRKFSGSPEKRKFKCICGDRRSKRRRLNGEVKCQRCGVKQHRSCTGWHQQHAYFCPPCWTSLPAIPSPATLVVTPQPIFSQWLSEMTRHTPSLRVFTYQGGEKQGFIQPSVLASYDVVITTYDVLSYETLYTADAPQRKLRREERFLRKMCPLTKVGWWRVVCDEAQLFESDQTRINQMMPLLTSEHRWSVTGTPIQRSITDLYFLTRFMGLGDLDNKLTWINLLLNPYLAGYKPPLFDLLRQVFWRSSKDDVAQELGLPEQTFTRHLLNFSPIEETFYEQEHQSSAGKLREAIRKCKVNGDRTLDSLDRSTLRKILAPLLNLRQACTHPQVVSGVSINSASGAANLNDLFLYLSRRAKQECEEALRVHIAALNGHAGLFCIKGEWAEAVICYRLVFNLTEQYKDQVNVDTLQRIHALANCAQVLRDHGQGIPPTLRDASLTEQVEDLDAKYRSKPEANFQASFASFSTLSEEVNDIVERFESAPDAYWVPICLGLQEFEKELVDKLYEELGSNDPSDKEEMKAFLRSLNTVRKIEVLLRQWCTSLENHHDLATEALPNLSSLPVNVLVDQATSCHLRNTPQKGQDKCELCKMEHFMLDLECDLFATKKKTWNKRNKDGSHDKIMDGAETKGSWKASNAERVLSVLVNFAKNKAMVEPWALADFKLHMQLLETMKKEFKQLRSTWTELNHLVQASDELAMARIRLKLPDAWDETPEWRSSLSLTRPNKNDFIHVIHPAQVGAMLHNVVLEREVSLTYFKKKYGRMLYLDNLGSSRNATPDPCPVCKSQLEKKWVVLECGHCYCIPCIQTLCVLRVKCPVCREVTEGRNLCFIHSAQVEENDNLSVVGDFPTKVAAVVRTTLKLLAADQTVKILIFSTWPEVLKVLEKALAMNGVSLLRLSHVKHQITLEKFRDIESGVSVLLLPLSWGSRGLNLVEATHVFLTEPILNPSDELQAIGRVHRIGQTKATTVHRFLISGTIEERIQATVTEAKDKWTNKNITLDALQNLFELPTPINI